MDSIRLRAMAEGFIFHVHTLIISSLCIFLSHARDTIRHGDVLRDNETLVSASGVFELGIFGDTNNGNRFLGIWFKDDRAKKAVWVANRETPILDSSGVFQIRDDGNMIIIDRRQTPFIVNSGNLATSGNTSAILLDSGNLILTEKGKKVWQSFDFPTDTFLPGMKLGWLRLNTDQPRDQVLVSWVSPQNPTRGSFTLAISANKSTHISVWRGYSMIMDIGFWDGNQFHFIFENSSTKYNFSYVSNENETYFTFEKMGSYVSTWFALAWNGQIEEFTLDDGKILTENHSLCEGNSTTCLTSMCNEGDNFWAFNGSMPASMIVGSTINMSIIDCEIMCKYNCSCTAYAYTQVNQSGCQLYYGNLDDLLDIIEKGGGTVYVRGNAPNGSGGSKPWRLWVIILGSLLGPILVSCLCYLQWKNHQRKSDDGSRSPEPLFQLERKFSTDNEVRNAHEINLGYGNDQELPLFSFSTLEFATSYFAASNKLGEGGFGPVYKGKLEQGQEIAVKRLGKRSVQGVEEFKNEVALISKLQHRNLVQLLGCCIEGEENLLVYEYMPNKSLDSFIFDPTKRVLLDWRRRVNIIEGIAQGLLYLHKYSRLRIIHRDLKTSNILLDNEVNPKISDFGMARIFGENETRAKTIKIAGTYGYMSPEYAMDGFFSEKSDVFSFGVIILEIISGMKNVSFYDSNYSLNLLGHAWNLWREGRHMEFVDSTLSDSCSADEVSRYIQLGLLCVQDRAADRPPVAHIVSMLNMERLSLPSPKEPAYLANISSTNTDSSSNKKLHVSFNDEATSTAEPEPR